MINKVLIEPNEKEFNSYSINMHFLVELTESGQDYVKDPRLRKKSR